LAFPPIISPLKTATPISPKYSASALTSNWLTPKRSYFCLYFSILNHKSTTTSAAQESMILQCPIAFLNQLSRIWRNSRRRSYVRLSRISES
jgi:hypothetical protein